VLKSWLQILRKSHVCVIVHFICAAFYSSESALTQCCARHNCSWQGCGMHVRCALFGIEEKDRCPNWKGGVYDPCQVSENAGKETSNEQKWNKLLHYDNVYSVFGLLLLTGYSSSFFERDDWWLHNKYNIPSLKAVVTMRECTSCERPNNVRFLWCSAFCNESIFGKNWHITVGLSLTDWTVIKVK